MRPARMLITFVFAAAVVVVPVTASGSGVSSRLSAGGPNAIFAAGYNKCKLASVAAMTKAAGKPYARAKFDGKSCTWSSADGNYVVLVDSHPTGYLDMMVLPPGKHGSEVVTAVRVAGASKAVIDTHSHALTGRYAKDLFASYPSGDVQVSMNYSTKLSDAAVLAVLRLVTSK
jgi:hypothetical protein